MTKKEQKNITSEDLKLIFEGKNKLYIATVASIAALLLALFNLPIEYYSLLRWLICGTSAYLAYQLHIKEKNSFTFWAYSLIAFIYNPIFQLHLGKDFWGIINIVTILAFIFIVKTQKDFFIINKDESK